MADYENKNGTGVAFKNDKRPDDRYPNYKGVILTPSGEKLDIAIWDRTSKGGRNYFSIKVSTPFKKEEMGYQSAQPKQEPTYREPEPQDEQSDLPF